MITEHGTWNTEHAGANCRSMICMTQKIGITVGHCCCATHRLQELLLLPEFVSIPRPSPCGVEYWLHHDSICHATIRASFGVPKFIIRNGFCPPTDNDWSSHDADADETVLDNLDHHLKDLQSASGDHRERFLLTLPWCSARETLQQARVNATAAFVK
jgi:hypothetical protein